MSADLYALALDAHQAGRLKDAERLYRLLLQANPRHPQALANYGALNLQQGKRKEGLKLLDQSLQIAPNQPHALNSRGNGLKAAGRRDEALRDYDRALALDPHFTDAHHNRGVVLHELGRHPEALAAYDAALTIEPGHADAQWNRAITLLLLGRYAEGWALHETRWLGEQFAGQQLAFDQPLWLGQVPVEGKTILIHFEQGLGDTLQMLRYAPLLAEAGATVLAAVQPALREVAQTVTGIDQVFLPGEPLPPFDLHAPMMSLPLGFGTTLENVPQNIPYLAAPEGYADKWAGLLGPNPDSRKRIGVAVSGSATHRNDHNRSIPLAALAPALNRAHDYVSLQVDYRSADRHALKPSGLRNVAEQLDSFADTAGLIANLDLVITVDTAVAHLAGAMGKPVWLLLPFVPDFRWGVQGETTPWHPSMRLYRQPALGDWASVIARLKADLA